MCVGGPLFRVWNSIYKYLVWILIGWWRYGTFRHFNERHKYSKWLLLYYNIFFESVEPSIWNESLMKVNNFLTRWPFDLSWFGSSAWALFSESRFPNSCIFLIADCNKGRLELAMTASMSTWVGKKVFYAIQRWSN